MPKKDKKPDFTHVAKACGCWTRIYASGDLEQLVCRAHASPGLGPILPDAIQMAELVARGLKDKDHG